jgi:hypothetical protein
MMKGAGRMADVTHDEIYHVLKRDRLMTYVVANKLRMEHRHHKALKTSKVLRKLKSMEKCGLVERVASPYAAQICWRSVPTF